MSTAIGTQLSLRDALHHGANLLAGVSDEAHLEAQLLLMGVLGLGRSQLYQRLADPLPAESLATYNKLLARRLNHEPTPYILKHREFYGLGFEVSPAAIIPRPETETLVDLVIAFAGTRF